MALAGLKNARTGSSGGLMVLVVGGTVGGAVGNGGATVGSIVGIGGEVGATVGSTGGWVGSTTGGAAVGCTGGNKLLWLLLSLPLP